ncbi:elongation factor P maturation arginine rhamnosyltransferase EarP [Candidatus Ferrigenium straubiae]|jgi:uncharacterized repeat protein (TIGR03837 family)|uniref:elongation factor P maturation arginine rhamnosyltransferase EarP n=1 Tax=Candidatus Ferrigenium straubiae TaxID=2919506 RepID=UPI003F4AE61C
MINDIPNRCDIFCNVIDNYGDIGVCWRLARQLAQEHGLTVRLWVDDLDSLVKLCPEADAARDVQHCRGVEVRRWQGADRPFTLRYLRANGEEEAIQPAELVVEAFACKLPQGYLEAMAAREPKPVWINLEYLSAEEWVGTHHKLPSPQPSLPLTRYFFFPGFTPKTGGLLLERDLFAQRDAFRNDAVRQRAFWASFGMEVPGEETLKVSLFGYENDALVGLLDAWAGGEQPVLCLVPEGRILPQVGQYFGDPDSPRPLAGEGLGERAGYSRGKLQVRVLPFVEQERYDELLWACDINFVRGEDSCVRAQWAARPFVWHIYPQHDGVHMQKLSAFMARYCAGLPPEAEAALRGLWEAWNSGGALPIPVGQAWNDFREHQSMLRQRAQGWALELAENNLALNLLDFFRETGRMRAFKIEGQ